MQGSSSLVDTLHVERRKVDKVGTRQVNLLVGPMASVSVPVDLVASIDEIHVKNDKNWNNSDLDLRYATNGTYAGILAIDNVNFANDTAEIRALGNAPDLRYLFRNNTSSSARTIDSHPGFFVEGIKSKTTVSPAYAWEYLPTNDTRVIGFGLWDATIPLLTPFMSSLKTSLECI